MNRNETILTCTCAIGFFTMMVVLALRPSSPTLTQQVNTLETRLDALERILAPGLSSDVAGRSTMKTQP